ncbi:hypothetical protein GUITHDRAFT_132641 [Guillardia theta CCMP2712]|uniref:tRNA-binding domain-containing protein n=1 Tax=Guillardia theta (strain CCMP2712) TaxID=905079 RepID=L1K1N5_GUITC|nr:hypothetical protein GUITHDRAFT_132641 [Guillardia theta CCMP2712]EKX54263.1 hypothetical protein GUITHDRAFT_132641 [Guillardia theta CCMP2712]|eukprot:XP_005841243.1 hypothetical protein GUITHDRAFT_132641 [Guillardia theta CCMP2712]
MLDRSVAMVDGMIEELEAFLGVSSKNNCAMKDEKKKKVEKEQAKQPDKVKDEKRTEKGIENKKTDSKPDEKKNKAEKQNKEPKAAGDTKAAPASEGEQPEFTKLELKVGVLTKTWFHPDSEKLYCEEIDVGEEAQRQVASGLRHHFSLEEFCMVMASTSPDGKVGERIFIEGLTGEPFNPNQVQKKKVLQAVLPDLQTNDDCVACWQGKPFMTSAGPIKVKSNKKCPIG